MIAPFNRKTIFRVTCFAEATFGSPHSFTFFSRYSKSALPAYVNTNFDKVNQKAHYKRENKNVGRILPLFEPQFQCQNSGIVYGQAQTENHPSSQHNEKSLV